MTCISKDERTLRRKQDIRTAFGKSYMNLPPEVYFTPMGLECGHSMSPYLQGSICIMYGVQAWQPPEELMEDQLA